MIADPRPWWGIRSGDSYHRGRFLAVHVVGPVVTRSKFLSCAPFGALWSLMLGN